MVDEGSNDTCNAINFDLGACQMFGSAHSRRDRKFRDFPRNKRPVFSRSDASNSGQTTPKSFEKQGVGVFCFQRVEAATPRPTRRQSVIDDKVTDDQQFRGCALVCVSTMMEDIFPSAMIQIEGDPWRI